MVQGQALLDQEPSLEETAAYEKGFWTALKLIAVKYYAKPFLDILADQNKVAYIDLFAGPGLNLLGEARIPLPGSPLIPLMIREAAAGRSFDLVVAAEIDEGRFKALERRIAANLPRGTEKSLHQSDANGVVAKLEKIIEENGVGHSFVFLDPEGLEWKWESMKRLVASIQCDVILNFPSAGLNRNAGRDDSATRDTVSRFLGLPPNEIPLGFSEAWALQAYREGLQSLGKDISSEIVVQSEGSFHYHLIPAVRKTKGGSPWFAALESLRERLASTSSAVPEIIANQVAGKGQQPLF